MENKRITLSYGDRVIGSVKRPHLAPAEMERLKLTPAQLEQVDGDLQITVGDL